MTGDDREGRTLPAVLLCGGRGTRLGGDVEKPLVEVGGRSMIARVLDALADAGVSRVAAVASPHAPDTRYALVSGLAEEATVPCTVLDGSGEGYVADLEVGLSAVDRPAVTVAADLPLLRGRDVEAAIDEAISAGTTPGETASPPDETASPRNETISTPDDLVRSVTVCVPVAYKRAIGASVDTSFEHDGTAVVPTGLNVVGDGADRVVVRERDSVAVNVNRPGDLELTRRILRS
ncbi:NTP transferase domain-containing protein [Halobellus captivus]|uniref:NTP transferase domain-containing protein n=1 Tax=Halobellus captivus TaxID=2592614 RepID=UPI001EEFBB9D|nr:NTP transferase domain-containing protein [Halobellus captivus]